MKRLSPALLTIGLLVGLLASLSPAAELISEATARQQGLTRAWYSQVQLDPARHSIERARLAGDQLIVLTTGGTLQSFHAETGRSQWVTRVGEPFYPSLGPAIGEQHVAIVNGSTVYVLDRADGRERSNFRTTGGAAAGPAILQGHVYVPLFNGRMIAYPIGERRLTPWYYSSSGRLFQPPIVAANSVVWANDQGKLYAGNAASTGVRYWFEGGSPILAPPAALGDQVFAATLGGYVFAIDEARGRRNWRYTTGASVRNAPVAIGDNLYVATDEPALHTLDRKTGQVKWVTGGVAQFVAASEKRLYALDRVGGLMVLDRETGSPVSRVANQGGNTPVLNQQSDRLYVFSSDGTIQCFHEIGATTPYLHAATDAPAEGSGSKTKPEPNEPAGSDEGSGTRDADPFGGSDDSGDTDPFGGDADGDANDDPFGDDTGGDDDGGDPFDDPFG